MIKAFDNVIETFDDVIETFDNVIEAFDNVVEAFDNVVETFDNVIETSDHALYPDRTPLTASQGGFSRRAGAGRALGRPRTSCACAESFCDWLEWAAPGVDARPGNFPGACPGPGGGGARPHAVVLILKDEPKMAEGTSTVPGGDRASLEFTQERLTAWSDHAALLNLAPEDILALEATNDAAAAALADRTLKAQQAKSATVAWHAAAAANRDLARVLVQKIRYAASQAANPTPIYVAAMIPPPKDREDLPVPPVPTGLRVTLDTQGRAVLSFESTRFGGTVFAIQRQVQPVGAQPGPWLDLDTVLEREFTDESTPQGMAAIRYRVRAERPVGASAYSAPVSLLMGAGGNQQATAGAIAPAPPVDSQAG